MLGQGALIAWPSFGIEKGASPIAPNSGALLLRG